MATVNPWRRFIGLLPGGARTVGEVIDVDEGAGTCRVRRHHARVEQHRRTTESGDRGMIFSVREIMLLSNVFDDRNYHIN